jgi:hypothetical protein
MRSGNGYKDSKSNKIPKQHGDATYRDNLLVLVVRRLNILIVGLRGNRLAGRGLIPINKARHLTRNEAGYLSWRAALTVLVAHDSSEHQRLKVFRLHLRRRLCKLDDSLRESLLHRRHCVEKRLFNFMGGKKK